MYFLLLPPSKIVLSPRAFSIREKYCESFLSHFTEKDHSTFGLIFFFFLIGELFMCTSSSPL